MEDENMEENTFVPLILCKLIKKTKRVRVCARSLSLQPSIMTLIASQLFYLPFSSCLLFRYYE